jgi:hypothetical protein
MAQIDVRKLGQVICPQCREVASHLISDHEYFECGNRDCALYEPYDSAASVWVAAPPLLNLTPHSITLVRDDKVWCRLAGSTLVARVREVVSHDIDATYDVGFPCIMKGFDATPDDIPLAPQTGVWLIVSALVAQAHPERSDLLFPDELVRDSAGKVIGCRRLAQAVHPL